MSVVDYLNEKGVPSSLEDRKGLYRAYVGPDTYTGTAAQNTALLAKMKAIPASQEAFGKSMNHLKAAGWDSAVALIDAATKGKFVVD